MRLNTPEQSTGTSDRKWSEVKWRQEATLTGGIKWTEVVEWVAFFGISNSTKCIQSNYCENTKFCFFFSFFLFLSLCGSLHTWFALIPQPVIERSLGNGAVFKSEMQVAHFNFRQVGERCKRDARAAMHRLQRAVWCKVDWIVTYSLSFCFISHYRSTFSSFQRHIWVAHEVPPASSLLWGNKLIAVKLLIFNSLYDVWLSHVTWHGHTLHFLLCSPIAGKFPAS